LLVVFACLVLGVSATACGGSGSAKPAGKLVVAVDAPFSRLPALAETIYRGVQLAATQADQAGGVRIGGKSYQVETLRLDNGLSPRRAVQNMRRAIAAGAIAVVSDGTGVNATWQLAQRAHVPIGIVYDGSPGLVDPVRRRNLFRIAITNHGVAFRLAEYLAPKHLRVALLYDDSGYGAGGYAELKRAFSYSPKSVVARIQLPSGAADLDAQILRARRAGATALVIWAQPPTIADALASARRSGWNVPVYTPPSGEDPLIRQQLAQHPAWVNGLTVALGRLTAEVGAAPFQNFVASYQAAFGVERVGVRASTGAPVIQLPDQAMYAYDLANVLFAAARTTKGSLERAQVLRQLEQVVTRGANGDERSFNEKSHEGVVDDDVFFARFEDMTWRPVRDDPLSASLPTLPQTATTG
jgi:ABC-type branched-subunit amino acid transport system substrate-binding protein